ncbi:MAG TPA: hypothetical protein VF645_11655 [Allosphingosinicella sp.]|jgi:hypothetical protein
MIELYASLPQTSASQPAEPGSLEANPFLWKAFGPVRLTIGTEEVYESDSAAVPITIIELANCIWRCCSTGQATTLSMNLEPVVDFVPEGATTSIIDTGQANEVLARIPNDTLLDYRKTILLKAKAENPGLFELMAPLLFGPVPGAPE